MSILQIDLENLDIRKTLLLLIFLAFGAFLLTFIIFVLIGISMGVPLSSLEGTLNVQIFLWPFMGWWFYPLVLLGLSLLYLIAKKKWLESTEIKRQKEISKQLLARRIKEK